MLPWPFSVDETAKLAPFDLERLLTAASVIHTLLGPATASKLTTSRFGLLSRIDSPPGVRISPVGCVNSIRLQTGRFHRPG